MPIILTNEPTSDYGGIQKYVARLAVTLAGSGRPVLLIEPKSERPNSWANIRILRYAGRGRLFSLISAFMVFARARKLSMPTIASIWFPSGFVAALCMLLHMDRLVILAHGSEVAPNKAGFRKMLMQWTFSQAKVVIANSRYTHDLLRSAGIRGHIEVVPCGVDSKIIARHPSEHPSILSVGRLIERKGFDRLIEAFPTVLTSVPNARLRIVGDGPLRRKLEQTVHSLGLSSRVDFLGALDDEALEEEYSRAWCFAMPCRRILDDVEGFGIVYLEAAMAGIPSIGGVDSGAADAIEDGVTGRLVDGNSVSAIADAVVVYLRDLPLAKIVGQRARERALTKCSWSVIAETIDQALDSKR